MSYGALRAVDNISFEVAEGEFFGILGPNGAGKTTTLGMIEGLRRPDFGEVLLLLGERSWPRGNTRLLKRVGVQLQASAVLRTAHRPGAAAHLRGALRRGRRSGRGVARTGRTDREVRHPHGGPFRRDLA